jgi:hypothetical protein
MKRSYFTGTGEKPSPDGYEFSDIKLSSKKKKHTYNGVRNSTEQESRVAKLFIALLVGYCMWFWGLGDSTHRPVL